MPVLKLSCVPLLYLVYALRKCNIIIKHMHKEHKHGLQGVTEEFNEYKKCVTLMQ